jgi:pyruvate-ferredoxin/flavodoxin oxidoreductase
MPEHGIATIFAPSTRASSRLNRARIRCCATTPTKGISSEQLPWTSRNPAPDSDWPAYTSRTPVKTATRAALEVPLTFADFAITEARFQQHVSPVAARLRCDRRHAPAEPSIFELP